MVKEGSEFDDKLQIVDAAIRNTCYRNNYLR